MRGLVRHIEQAWTEPLLLGCFALFILLSLRGQRTAAAATYGYFPQPQAVFAVLLPALVHLWERNIWRVLLGIGVAVATAVPFIIWDFRTVSGKRRSSFNLTKTSSSREDSLSITSALYPLIGPVNKSLTVIVGGIVVVVRLSA